MKLRRVIVCAFFVLAVALASIRSGPLAYGLLYASMLMPLLSGLYTIYVYRQLHLVQRIDSHSTIKNKPVPYICRISNETHISTFTNVELRFYSDLSELTSIDETKSFTLAAGDCVEMQSALICKRRGIYHIGVQSIIISDILGIMRPVFHPTIEYNVTVYPRVLPLDHLGIFDTEGVRTHQLVSHSATIAGDTVHEYTPGDDTRLINWKASARTGTLQVRQLSGVERKGMAFVIDLRRTCRSDEAIAREDNLLETVLAVSNYCYINGIDISVYAGDDLFEIKDNVSFNELYEWSCHMKFCEDAKQPAVPCGDFACVALLSTSDECTSDYGLFDAAQAGAECVFMRFGGDPEDQPPISGNSFAGFRYVHVPDKCELTDIIC